MAGAELETGAVVGGKFKLLRVLGMGGMGVVYEIEHVFTHHRRALKLLHHEVGKHPTIVERFLREASAAGRIKNPHIVETFDAGTLETGEPYLVMELLSGEDLTTQIRTRHRLELPYLAHLARQAAAGIDAAHGAGIVHRDLKPDNLFVTERDGRPFVKILDFGISKFDSTLTGDHGATREGSMLGTPYYMPPEQVRGAKDLDVRADVYALGVILYEAITGVRPFEADTLPHLALLIHEGKPRPLAELRPELPPAFCRVVEKAMAADREVRFQSMHALAEALEPFETNEARDAYAATLAVDASALPPPSSQLLAPPSELGRVSAKTADEPARTARVPSIEAAALGRTVAQAQVTPKGRWPAVLAVAAVLVVVGIGYGMRTGASERTGAASAEPGTALPSATVLPAAPGASAAREVCVDAAAPPSSAAPTKPSGATHAAQAPAPSASTKAQKTGLVQENPY